MRIFCIDGSLGVNSVIGRRVSVLLLTLSRQGRRFQPSRQPISSVECDDGNQESKTGKQGAPWQAQRMGKGIAGGSASRANDCYRDPVEIWRENFPPSAYTEHHRHQRPYHHCGPWRCEMQPKGHEVAREGAKDTSQHHTDPVARCYADGIAQGSHRIKKLAVYPDRANKERKNHRDGDREVDVPIMEHISDVGSRRANRDDGKPEPQWCGSADNSVE